MAEVNANSLPAKTDLGTNDSAIVVDQTTNAGALVDLDVLADKVLDRITSKPFANQVGGSSAATLLAQLSTLNSNFASPTSSTSVFRCRDLEFEVSYEAGAVGSRGCQVSSQNPVPTGAYIHSILIRGISNSAAFIPIVWYEYSDDKFYCNAYRTATYAQSGHVSVRVFYYYYK